MIILLFFQTRYQTALKAAFLDKIPNISFPFFTVSFIASIRLYCFKYCIAVGKAPTPGNITLSDFKIFSGSFVINELYPKKDSALCMLVIFPKL